MKKLASTVTWALLLAGAGCSAPRQAPLTGRSGNISAAQAAQIAVVEFEKRYPGKIVHYKFWVHPGDDGATWDVVFDGQREYAIPGGDKIITVDVHTGRATVLPSF